MAPAKTLWRKHMATDSKLAILGGKPVRRKPWPKWPKSDRQTEQRVKEVLRSGRWAISGFNNGQELYEKEFAKEFASYHNSKYCVPTDHGTSALTIALEAIGVGFGDEVLVPGLTWVACASAVAGIGAIPVLVDIEADTTCMSLTDAARKITSRTKAILLVHSYCAVADIRGFTLLSENSGVPIIEDCSQAHGSKWNGKRVGTFGIMGVFSMQETKVLSCGEGGAVITNEKTYYERLQQLRADSRIYVSEPINTGMPELQDFGSIQGRNYCLSEIHSAILMEKLKVFDKENQAREEMGEYLRDQLESIPGVNTLTRHKEVDNLTYYHFCLRFNLDVFENVNIEVIRLALIEELGLYVERLDKPLNNNSLYNPLRSPRTSDQNRNHLDPKRFSLAVAERAYSQCLLLHHRVLLGKRSDVKDIVTAIAKIKHNASSLINY